MDMLTFGLGFLVYALFSLITIDVYSRKKNGAGVLALGFIYVYYTILAAYAINFMNVGGGVAEKVMQIGIYAIACAILVIYYYRNGIRITETSKIYSSA